MDGTGLRDEPVKDPTLAEYLAGVLPAHTAINRVPPRSWTWSTPAGVWKIEHTALILQGRRPAQIRLLGPDMSVFMPDDEAGIGIVMAILRTVGAVDREVDDGPGSRLGLIGRVVAECRRKYWLDGQTDEEFVAGVIAVLDIDGWLVDSNPAVDGGGQS